MPGAAKARSSSAFKRRTYYAARPESLCSEGMLRCPVLPLVYLCLRTVGCGCVTGEQPSEALPVRSLTRLEVENQVSRFWRFFMEKKYEQLRGTSHLERLNLSVRMHLRRYARRTNAHSHKLENHKACFALWVTWYNFVRVNTAVRMTPCMAAGITSTIWTIRDLLAEHI